MKPTKRSPGAAKTIDGYVAAAPAPSQERLRRLVAVVRAAAPDATERIAYGLPTWHQGENLIHLGGFAGHVGVYPGPAAIEAFAEKLAGYACSKGAIQLPLDGRLPVALVRSLVRWRLAQVAAKAAARPAPRRRTPAATRGRGRRVG
jgi:uncharacterized protein YdhG (YjbR/CyaY superfamily)